MNLLGLHSITLLKVYNFNVKHFQGQTFVSILQASYDLGQVYRRTKHRYHVQSSRMKRRLNVPLCLSTESTTYALRETLCYHPAEWFVNVIDIGTVI
jgi:CTP synthase (UTP-ammonia lyase)